MTCRLSDARGDVTLYREKGKTVKKLLHEIQDGKNLEKNLPRYCEILQNTYGAYGALELTFSAYMFTEELAEEKQKFAEAEGEALNFIRSGLEKLGTDTVENPDAFVDSLNKLRNNITNKMDLYTAYTDRMIVYEYVLNRMEYKFIPEKKLTEKLSEISEEAFMQNLSQYLYSNKDNSVVRDKINTVMGQIPVHMTRTKLFEQIKEALTLYKDGPKSSLDDFVYMLSTSAMIYQPSMTLEKDSVLQKAIDELEQADYAKLDADGYEHLATVLEQAAKYILEITDFYYSMQKVVNGMYAMTVLRPYLDPDSKLIQACRSIWVCLAKGQYMESMLTPLEGRIEPLVEKTSYLESVLFEVKGTYANELSSLGLREPINVFSLVANLLSDSLFIDLEKVTSQELADTAYVELKTKELLEALENDLKNRSKPVKRAIMSKILEKLPMLYTKSSEVDEYIRLNLFGCQDKAEKYVVIKILQDLMQE